MNFDAARITGQVNAFWDEHGYAVILGGGVLGLLLVLFAVVKVLRSQQRDRWLAVFAAAVVLAWTSEGLWEVARYTLGLPVVFAVATFFVFEAMIFRAASQAARHRRRYGAPGPAGRYVWFLATCTAVVVALNAATAVEALLRFVLPLAAAGLWWLDVTAERDSDHEVGPDGQTLHQRRLERAAATRATWALTPGKVLVRLGIKRPGEQTVTDAERDYRRRRMVVFADRLHTAASPSWTGRWAAHRLRRLARVATAEDVAVVVEQVRRAASIVEVVTRTAQANRTGQPDTGHAGGPDSGADMSGGRLILPPDTGQRTGHRRRTSTPADVRPAGAGQVTGRSTADLVARALAEQPRPTQADVATRLGISERTVRRHWRPADTDPDTGHIVRPDLTGHGNGHRPPG